MAIYVHDKCMAVKTITIDIEAYEVLSRSKKPGQSFSRVIKERLGGRKTGADLWNVLAGEPPTEATLDLIDSQVKRRRHNRSRAPKL